VSGVRRLVREGRDKRIAHAVELAVGRHLPQRPDASDEQAVRAVHRRGVAAEAAAGAGELELVARLGFDGCRELLHPLPVPLGLRQPLGDRKQPLGDGAVLRHAELDAQAPHRRVRDEELSVGIGEADAVEGRVDERGLQRREGALRPFARAQSLSDEAGADAQDDERSGADEELSSSRRAVLNFRDHDPEACRDRCSGEATRDTRVEADQPDPRCEGQRAERRVRVEEEHRAEREAESDSREDGDDGGTAGGERRRHGAPAS